MAKKKRRRVSRGDNGRHLEELGRVCSAAIARGDFDFKGDGFPFQKETRSAKLDHRANRVMEGLNRA
ncbi:MAG: hypothetical protein HYV54_00920 [Parcubacteria group bacterium]|nr:hypothetical protein [Parcubacteria group bacterium]